ncbi:M23 family metallopeptidase [Candidatus Kaiserbacteria bacterium]|nr:M23 family metallopeptidase [Candidatus Kaiserbacteria bacterium]
MTKKIRTRLNSVSLSLTYVAVTVLLIISPAPAHAGLVSFITSLLYTTNEISEQGYNSQTALVLKAARNVDPNPSKGGGDITVVDDSALLSEIGPAGTLADIEERPQHGGRISIYVVREGDSLSQIAKMFGVSTNTIIWGNDIKRGSLIKEGQTLVILPVSGVQHTVQKGDTLKGIAKKYKGDFEEILQFNGFSENTVLAVGDIITVPAGEIAAPVYSGSTKVVSGSGGPSYSGYYIRPIVGGRKSQGLHGYNGVDLAASSGTPIVASATGDIIVVRNGGWNGGYGTYAVIRHGNGTQTLYAHMSTTIVYSGQHVVQGQVIGYVGNTGRSTGAHLHFEVRGAKNPF